MTYTWFFRCNCLLQFYRFVHLYLNHLSRIFMYCETIRNQLSQMSVNWSIYGYYIKSKFQVKMCPNIAGSWPQKLIRNTLILIDNILKLFVQQNHLKDYISRHINILLSLKKIVWNCLITFILMSQLLLYNNSVIIPFCKKNQWLHGFNNDTLVQCYIVTM